MLPGISHVIIEGNGNQNTSIIIQNSLPLWFSSIITLGDSATGEHPHVADLFTITQIIQNIEEGMISR